MPDPQILNMAPIFNAVLKIETVIDLRLRGTERNRSGLNGFDLT